MNEKISVKEYVYKVSLGVSNAVLVALGVGLLLETIGQLTGIATIGTIGTVSKLLLAPAFGAGIAYQLKTNTLVIFTSMIAATIASDGLYFSQAAIDATTMTGINATQGIGAVILTGGQPISAVMAGLVAALIGKWLTGKTPLDMILVPLGSLFFGGLAGVGFAYVTTPMLLAISGFMAQSITISPILGSIVIAVAWSTLLMTPASSVALAIALQLDPVSSAAALIGCTAQFVGFTVMSFKENNLGANIAQGLITPKVQFANLTKNPQMVIPPFLSAAICAPLATTLFHFTTSYELAGLGLNSLIAPLNLFANDRSGFLVYCLIGVLLSGTLTYIFYRGMLALGKATKGSLTIELQ
ncbi:PTS transporter subunit IIC [Enterococcus sp. DIV0876]|uniref:PTS transporter subunit IIC n=1 Tax=Enterococcus sp. DIV0876 TaxID=2774633 RepID=UPI003D3015EF